MKLLLAVEMVRVTVCKRVCLCIRVRVCVCVVYALSSKAKTVAYFSAVNEIREFS